MKMTRDDYNALKKAVFEAIDEDPEILTRNINYIVDMEEARRWTLYWMANKDNAFRFDYLKDSHIDTALRNIVAEYKKRHKDVISVEWDGMDYRTKLGVFIKMIADMPEITFELLKILHKFTPDEINAISFEAAKMYYFKYKPNRIVDYIRDSCR